ncbi:unnamed protein product [Ascophyllum nodosum]
MTTQSSPRQRGKQEETDAAVGIQVGAPEDQKQITEAQKKRIVQMLLGGDVYGPPGSSGKKLSNFREWAKNQHPLCSMFVAHELYPFTRRERFCVMMCYLCWAVLITAIFEAILATCGCAQNLPGGCKRFFECVGSFVLAVLGCLSIIC